MSPKRLGVNTPYTRRELLLVVESRLRRVQHIRLRHMPMLLVDRARQVGSRSHSYRGLLLVVMVESPLVRHRLHPVGLVYSTRVVVSRSCSYRSLLLENRRRLRYKGKRSTCGRDPGAPGLGQGDRRLGVGSSWRDRKLLRSRANRRVKEASAGICCCR